MARDAPVLWAEDNPEDQILIRAALAEIRSAPSVRFANDGVHLLAELQAPGPRPRLVVLDLKMPRMGGLETLRRLRDSPAWRGLDVCIFSAGNHPAEVAECRALGALDVVQKPVDFPRFVQAVQAVVARRKG